MSIGNILIFIAHKSYPTVLVLRAISAIGFALNLTATTPMSNQLIQKGQIEKCLSYTISTVPLASLISTLTFPILVK